MFHALISLISINEYLLHGVDGNCCSCLEGLLQPNHRYELILSDSVLSGEYKRIDERLMTEAFVIIDNHLKRSIDSNDFGTNLDELRAVIRNELEAKSIESEPQSWWTRWRRIQCLSQQLSSRNRDVMVNALMRLLQLEHVNQGVFRCTILFTQELAENNRIAQDTIGRRNRNDPFRFPRLDNIIFDTALRRAEKCIPYYRNRLRVSETTDAFETIHKYWSRILEHRFDAAHFGVKHGKVDQIFNQHPRGALDLVEKMPHAIEEDEIEMAQEFLDAESEKKSIGTMSTYRLRNLQYEVELETPCSDYIGYVMHTFDSLDFDLQMEQYISSGVMEAARRDGEISRMKAYFLLCRKLINERNRFIEFISSP